MKYVCKICGYIYDEDKENVKFEDLSDDWTCPLCGADKSAFSVESQPQKKEESMKVLPKHELKELTYGEVSAICSNLAKGCEKQYKNEEMKMFLTLADYFATLTPEIDHSNVEEILDLVQMNLNEDYQDVTDIATQYQDRGTLRVCVWGEKVTRILNSLLTRYEKEGETFLENTNVWICTTCGFVYVGDKAPQLCPVCKVPEWKFEKIEGEVQ